jgi:hypothetical protein
MQQSQQEGRNIVFGGTDYGLANMAITVHMSLELFEQKHSPYNRYAILANLGTDEPMFTDNHIKAWAVYDNAHQKAASTKSYFQMPAQGINQRALNRKHERKRNRRKKNHQKSKRLKRFSLLTACMVL